MKRLVLFTLCSLILAGTSLAQGLQTGTIRGMVKDQQDRFVPGATVTVTSSALLGPRSAVSDATGQYVIPSLPPGSYDIKFELSGFATLTRTTMVPLGLTVTQDVTMRPGGVVETVQVVAQTPAPIESPVVGMNFKQPEIEQLATPRTLQGIAQLSPAVSENSPNTNQIVINGAFAFDSAFLVNGVDVNDNVLAQPQSLFVEDAIEETQVLTSGISAEYGRFSGGVVNAVTKSGGNLFSGSARVNFQDPSWTTETPFEESRSIVHTPDFQQIYEGTFGGPLVRDRLWFFTSGRYAAVQAPRTLAQTGVQVVSDDKNKRGEIKLTGMVAPNHTLQGGFMNNPRTTTNSSGVPSLIIDPNALSTISTPNRYFHGNYRGVVGNSRLIEAQISGRHNELIGGGTGSDLVTNSPFVATTFCCIYNAPYFDGVDAEQRNNRQITGSVTDFWNAGGRHETKGGYEWYRSQRTGGGSQSPTQYVFVSDFATGAGGAPVVDATGRPVPVFKPGVSHLQYFPAVTGAVLNNDSHSLYLADHWVIGSRLSADLGARFEHVSAVSTGSIVSISNSRIVPRLAVAYDIKGDGDKIVHVTYGQYSGRYNEAQIGKNSPVGNSPQIDSIYRGPAGQGYDFAAGVNPVNYPISSANSSVTDPTQNVFMTEGTTSPLTHEFSLSFGENLFNDRGYAEVTYVARVTNGLIEDFLTLDGGTTNVTVDGISAGTFTNVVFANTDEAHRQYQGLVFQSRYRISNAWNISGHYTLQLKNDGNYEGEGTNQPGNKSFIGDYPEAFNAARNFPDGRLQDFQRSRLRIWSVYNWGMGTLGDLSVSGLWRLDSGRVYSLAARNVALTPTQTAIIQNAGYVDLPSSTGNMVFFNGERGSETFPGHGLFDTSINYNIPVFRTLRPWVKFDIFNLFDNKKLIAWNTTIAQNPASPKDNLGLATDYTKGATYGTATGNTVTNLYSTTINAYPVAFNGATPGGRTFRMAIGFRF